MNKVEIALSEMSNSVIFKQFSEWHKGQIIIGVRLTAGPKQFIFYVGDNNKVVESKDHAKLWKSYQRTTAISKNTELETDLRLKFD